MGCAVSTGSIEEHKDESKASTPIQKYYMLSPEIFKATKSWFWKGNIIVISQSKSNDDLVLWKLKTRSKQWTKLMELPILISNLGELAGCIDDTYNKLYIMDKLILFIYDLTTNKCNYACAHSLLLGDIRYFFVSNRFDRVNFKDDDLFDDIVIFQGEDGEQKKGILFQKIEYGMVTIRDNANNFSYSSMQRSKIVSLRKDEYQIDHSLMNVWFCIAMNTDLHNGAKWGFSLRGIEPHRYFGDRYSQEIDQGNRCWNPHRKFIYTPKIDRIHSFGVGSRLHYNRLTTKGDKQRHVTGYSLFEIQEGDDENPTDFDVILVHHVFIVIFLYQFGDIYVYNVKNDNTYKAKKKLDLNGVKVDSINYDGYQYFYFFLNDMDKHVMINKFDVLPKVPECFPFRTVDGYIRMINDNEYIVPQPTRNLIVDYYMTR